MRKEVLCHERRSRGREPILLYGEILALVCPESSTKDKADGETLDHFQTQHLVDGVIHCADSARPTEIGRVGQA
jgi:hypothetical protein